MKTAKAEKIKKTLKETRERRENQVCRVYQLKLQNLSKKDIEKLDRLFLEAKWLRNFVIADIENRTKDYKYKEVEIKIPDGFEKREIKTLSSQMKQELIDQIKDDLKNLKKSKENGNKVGKLKFKSEVRTIPLKQYGVTYKISGDRNRVKIQGIKKKFRVLGLHQIPENAEITKGYLIKRPSGFYLHVVCYLPKEEVLKEIEEKRIPQPVGIDLGVKHQLTLSNGEKFNWYIPETKRLKRLQKTLSKKEKGSKNYQKINHLIKREWEYISNKRKDIHNKVISYLKRFSLIAIQDDSIKSWKDGLFGKQIQNTGIGGITARLRNLATLIPVLFVDRYEATTQTCSFCGHRQEILLSERTFKCESCGREIDRDVNSARNILKTAIEQLLWMLKVVERIGEGKLLKTLPVGSGEVKPVERVIALVEAGSLPL
ncbi:transposase IS605 OrfB [Desulfurobacterium thermolithotrophum DSM 11699]|uniref:Transposase IS605 OrfB n=1 Tax=Desulfurobacterium thermolithotrophum (strain DSM 11699 / BSA) TaxID=868864 RepID=F0S2H2_DESTD|nr:RNA-guided endonuclease TnpB family protein [Desulfurobacterium thermolithotrophum]ADY73044.1 transposase IS605 OrfB [Desulfurobacterium thermolithotrophum DSM 11699]